MEQENIVQNEVNLSGQHPDYKSEIVDIIRKNLTPNIIRERILDYHENDIAMALDLLKKEERTKLYSILSNEVLASVFEYSEMRNQYISELAVRRRAVVLSLF